MSRNARSAALFGFLFIVLGVAVYLALWLLDPWLGGGNAAWSQGQMSVPPSLARTLEPLPGALETGLRTLLALALAALLTIGINTLERLSRRTVDRRSYPTWLTVAPTRLSDLPVDEQALAGLLAFAESPRRGPSFYGVFGSNRLRRDQLISDWADALTARGWDVGRLSRDPPVGGLRRDTAVIVETGDAFDWEAVRRLMSAFQGQSRRFRVLVSSERDMPDPWLTSDETVAVGRLRLLHSLGAAPSDWSEGGRIYRLPISDDAVERLARFDPPRMPSPRRGAFFQRVPGENPGDDVEQLLDRFAVQLKTDGVRLAFLAAMAERVPAAVLCKLTPSAADLKSLSSVLRNARHDRVRGESGEIEAPGIVLDGQADEELARAVIVAALARLHRSEREALPEAFAKLAPDVFSEALDHLLQTATDPQRATLIEGAVDVPGLWKDWSTTDPEAAAADAERAGQPGVTAELERHLSRWVRLTFDARGGSALPSTADAAALVKAAAPWLARLNAGNNRSALLRAIARWCAPELYREEIRLLADDPNWSGHPHAAAAFLDIIFDWEHSRAPAAFRARLDDLNVPAPPHPTISGDRCHNALRAFKLMDLAFDHYRGLDEDAADVRRELGDGQANLTLLCDSDHAVDRLAGVWAAYWMVAARFAWEGPSALSEELIKRIVGLVERDDLDENTWTRASAVLTKLVVGWTDDDFIYDWLVHADGGERPPAPVMNRYGSIPPVQRALQQARRVLANPGASRETRSSAGLLVLTSSDDERAADAVAEQILNGSGLNSDRIDAAVFRLTMAGGQACVEALVRIFLSGHGDGVNDDAFLGDRRRDSAFLALFWLGEHDRLRSACDQLDPELAAYYLQSIRGEADGAGRGTGQRRAIFLLSGARDSSGETSLYYYVAADDPATTEKPDAVRKRVKLEGVLIARDHGDAPSAETLEFLTRHYGPASWTGAATT